MGKKIEVEDLTIVVSRYWPLHKLKTVEVRKNDTSFRNEIVLTAEQAKTLHAALTDVLDLRPEPQP